MLRRGTSTFYILGLLGSSVVWIAICKMTKRKAVDDNSIPPAKRLLHNVDAMGCLLAATKAEFDKDIKAMHRRVEDLSKEVLILKSEKADLKSLYRTLQTQNVVNEKYADELEDRMAALEAVISNMLNRGEHDVVVDVINNIKETGNYLTEDLDRLLQDAETELEDDWFEDLL